ncbi:MAG TPA: hypothetical protein VK689_13650 [Armatimonadota bacterium]|nr:hypothetical protein [Armatimonadota bacterium]
MSWLLLPDWVRWGTGLLLLLLGLWISVLNAAVFWQTYVLRKHSPSWIPLLGGGMAALALAILPVPQANQWWWLPFLLDWGSLPGLLDTAIWHGMRVWRERQGRQ